MRRTQEAPTQWALTMMCSNPVYVRIDSITMSHPPSDDLSKRPKSTTHQVDATIRFEGPKPKTGNGRGQPSASKQDRDPRLRGRARRVRRHVPAPFDGVHCPLDPRMATRRWADHLAAQNLIAPDRKSALEDDANQWLRRILAEFTSDTNVSLSQRDRLLSHRLDSTGKLTKLLGLADSSVLPEEEIESRKIGARYTLLRKLGPRRNWHRLVWHATKICGVMWP